MEPVKIAITDDCPLTRYSLRTLLSQTPVFHICHEACNGKELIDYLNGTNPQPDVCILDIGMPVMNGYDTIIALNKKWPAIKVVVLSHHNSNYSVHFMLQHGANAFLAKKDALLDIQDTVHSVITNGYYYTEAAPKKLFDRIKTAGKIPELSEQQKKLVTLICQGCSNKEIAAIMNISVRTVESYKDKIYQKLNLTEKGKLIPFLVSNELIHIPNA